MEEHPGHVYYQVMMRGNHLHLAAVDLWSILWPWEASLCVYYLAKKLNIALQHYGGTVLFLCVRWMTFRWFIYFLLILFNQYFWNGVPDLWIELWFCFKGRLTASSWALGIYLVLHQLWLGSSTVISLLQMPFSASSDGLGSEWLCVDFYLIQGCLSSGNSGHLAPIWATWAGAIWVGVLIQLTRGSEHLSIFM